MKHTLFQVLLGIFLLTSAQAADLYLPNLGKNATGTTTGTRRGLDVYISGGSLGGATAGSVYTLGDVGTSSLAVRSDAEGILAGVADGDYTPLQVDANGRLKVDAALTEAATAADGGALPAQTKVASGYDGANVQVLKTDVTGSLQVDVESSALPTGAATEAKQDAGITELTAIEGNTDGLEASLTAIDTKLGGTLTVDGSGVTQPVSAASLPLPTGAATEVTLATLATEATAATLATEATAATLSTEATLSAMNTKVPSGLTVTTNRLMVDGSAVTQPVSAASLPLPTGAATEAKQDTAITSLGVIEAQTAANASGSITAAAEDVSTTAETQTAPAGAVGFLIQADDTNTANLRFAVGATAELTRGIQLQAGRSEQLEIGANVSVIAESGTQKYQIQWVIK